MARPMFFIVYESTEGTEIITELSEGAAVNVIAERYKNRKETPHLLIRGESIKVSVETYVRFGE